MTTEPNNQNLQRAINDSLAPADMSDADIERLLNDVTAKPMSDATVARILKQANPAHPSDRTVRLPRGLHEPGDRPGSSKEIAMSLSNPNRTAGGSGINRGSVAAMVVSAVCLLVVLVITARPRVPGEVTNDPPPIADNFRDVFEADAIVPQVASAVKQVAKVAIGDMIQTKARERRRFSLPDGSVLFMNENTTAKVEDLRMLNVTSGEVFVEVCPKFDDEDKREFFYVNTPSRTVTAIGTKFAVRANTDNTDVLVTQGKVKIDDIEEVVSAGKYVSFNANEFETAAAPRASEALGWTEDLMVAAPIVPRSKYCGGALISVDPNGQEMRLSMRKYHVDVHIEDGFARTTIDQTYFNHTHSRLEGKFKFPLPANASLSRLAMYVGPKLMEGGMAERDHARNTFEQIVHRQKDPALLEWIDGSTFSMRIFPLEARQEKRLIISYTQRLNTAYGKTQYRFPAGHNLDVVRDWSTTVRVKGGEKLAWKSPSHAMKADQAEGDLVLKSAMTNALFDRDVVLEIQDDWAEPSEPNKPKALASGLEGKARSGKSKRDGSKTLGGDAAKEVVSSVETGRALRPEASAFGSIGSTGAFGSRLSRTVHEDHQYLMLRHRPELKADAKKQNRDWVFLFETSGDRNPVLARAQIEVIRTLLTNAEHEDTFNIVTAGTRPTTFRESGVSCDAENIDAAIAWLEKSHLIGALDFEQGLKASVGLFEPKAIANSPGGATSDSLGRKPQDQWSATTGNPERVTSNVQSSDDMPPRRGSSDEGRSKSAGLHPQLHDAAPPGLSVSRERYLVHVGSGLPVLGQTSEKELVETLPQSIRYVGVGVGKRWSRQFMKMAASRTGGYFTQINPDEQVNWRAFELLSVLNAPRLLNVNVIDEAEKLLFLTYTESIAHGDEICAIARLPKDAKLPKSLIVAGQLNGKTWKQSVPVNNVADKADYLPRSWARLEIDRLIADGAGKHRDEIIKLSKAMYVMSPFTSLLVLENEAMYTQYNIDRGRKDHWALYPAPDTIKVVHEPVQRGLAKKKSEQTNVLDTVLSRNANAVFGTYYDDLVREYNSYMDAGRYAEALVVAKKARELQPDSPVNLVRVEKARFARQFETNEQRADDVLAILNDVEESLIPLSGEVQYPKNWSELGRQHMRFDVPEQIGINFNFSLSDLDINSNGIVDLGQMTSNNTRGYFLKSLYSDVDRDLDGTLDALWVNLEFPNFVSPREFDNTLQTTTTWDRFGRNRLYSADTGLNANSLFDSLYGVRPTQDDFSRTVVGLQSPENFAEGFGLATDFISPRLGLPVIEQEKMSSRSRRFRGRSQQLGRFEQVPVLDSLESPETPIFAVDPPQYFEGRLLKNAERLKRPSELRLLESIALREEEAKLREEVRVLVGGNSLEAASEEGVEQARRLPRRSGASPDGESLMRLRRIITSNGRSPDEGVETELGQAVRQHGESLSVSDNIIDEFRIRSIPQRQLQELIVSFDETTIPADELFGVSGWGLTRGRSSQPIDAYFERGLNLITPQYSGRSFTPYANHFINIVPSFRYLQPTQRYDFYRQPVMAAAVPTRFLSDLIAHAPGLNSTRADLLTVVAAESKKKPTRGKVDDAAKKLIERARGLGWETVSIGQGDNAVQVHVNGAGQFAWERTVFEGLGEQILCDGEHLWHLYEEIGLGAKRDYSRFHRQLINDVAPWLVAPIDELSIGADVIAIDGRTVGIVPFGQKRTATVSGKALAAGTERTSDDLEASNGLPGASARPLTRGESADEPKALASGLRAKDRSKLMKRGGSPTSENNDATNIGSELVSEKAPRPEASAYGSRGTIRIELVFATDGRLKERRVIRVLDSETKTLVRVTCGQQGIITVFNSKNEQVAKIDRARREQTRPFGGLVATSAKETIAARKDMVILPLPYRDAKTILTRVGAGNGETNGDYSKWSEEDALALLASDAIHNNRDRMASIVMSRFFKKGDTRAGLYVLIANANPMRTVKAAANGQPAVQKPLLNYQPNSKVSEKHKALVRFARHLATASTDNEFDANELVAANESSFEPKALASGLSGKNGSKKMERGGTATSERDAKDAGSEVVSEKAPRPEASAFGSKGAGRFLYNICRARNTYYRWKNFGAQKSDESMTKSQRQAIVDQTVEVVGSLRSPAIGWTILRTMQPKLDHADFHAKFADAAEKFENVPHLAWFVRHERARTLFKANKGDEAAKLYAELLTNTLKAGFNPGIDKELRDQFIKQRGQRNWTEMCRQTSNTLIENDLLRTAITLSKQLRDLGDIDTANAIFEKTISKLEPKKRPDVAVLALKQYRQLKKKDEADKILAGMLENPWLAMSAKLWRYGASLAEERGKSAEALRRLERAMTIEYIRRPDVIDLQDTRNRYTALLLEYEKIVDASATLDQEPPKDLAARIVRAADQWRSMEDDETQVCQLASKILTKLGKSDLAWDYATTPVGTQPGSASWRSLGQHLGRLKQIEKASDAYDRAFEFEKTNPEILWEHANLLRRNGRDSEANPLIKRIAESDWQPRFSGVKANATSLWDSLGQPATQLPSDPVDDSQSDPF